MSSRPMAFWRLLMDAPGATGNVLLHVAAPDEVSARAVGEAHHITSKVARVVRSLVRCRACEAWHGPHGRFCDVCMGGYVHALSTTGRILASHGVDLPKEFPQHGKIIPVVRACPCVRAPEGPQGDERPPAARRQRTKSDRRSWGR